MKMSGSPAASASPFPTTASINAGLMKLGPWPQAIYHLLQARLNEAAFI
jgi:hypothetical protein